LKELYYETDGLGSSRHHVYLSRNEMDGFRITGPESCIKINENL